MPPHHAFHGIDRLLAIMARLRAKDGGCPWDLEQNFATIAPYTIEEAYEVADAIERGDLADLKDELGDLLLQVVFHSRMAEEAGLFDFDAVASQSADKMIRRHPHVFGDQAGEVATAADQTRSWEALKAAERAGAEDASALAGVARGLPAMLRAVKLQKRAARVGFDWGETASVLDKIDEELGELRAELAGGGDPAAIREEAGDLLFAVANLLRRLDLDAETTLGAANGKFERRFRAMEALAAAAGRDFARLPLAEQESLWQRVKAAE